ncbi:hypothetical protein QTV44_000519 [Vibrio vulnificus]|nr:hypothetical protein [Vibrio vulnificus]
MYKILLLVIVSIAFPYEVRAMGLSAGPITIFLLYGLYITVVLCSLFKDRALLFTRVELVLILLYAISGVFTLMGGAELLNSIRFFYIYGSGFVLIALLYRFRLQLCDYHKYRNDLILCFVSVCMINIIIGILMFKSPSLGGAYLSLMNISDYYEVRSTEGTYFRLGTPITGPEATAELIILLAPLLLFLTIVKKQYIYSLSLIVSLQALMQTATRSGVILVGLNLAILVFLYNHHLRDATAKLLIFLLPLVLSAFLALNPEIVETVIYRFLEVSSGSDSSFSEQLNRGTVWETALLAVGGSVFIGNGLTRYTEGDYANFHSLYFTTVFQYGWFIGGFLIATLFKTLFELRRAYQRISGDVTEKLLLMSLFFGFGAFLVNEFKYEFTRFPSYMLTVFLFLYICIQSIEVNKCRPQ